MTSNVEVFLHNTLTRKKEKFEPTVPGKVGMYVCGPTVYGEPHLGHARGAITFDVVSRFFTHLGYKVRYVRNITDVGHLEDEVAEQGEDKITKKARLEQLEPMEVVQCYTKSYHDAMDQLNVLRPSIEPTATGHIMEQIDWIGEILANGYAYEVNGSVYFDVEKYSADHPYGELSGKVLEDLRGGSRSLDGQDEKRNSFDFALWKRASDTHIMKWKSPWSLGFPGWHIECTAMSAKYLGVPFDIHGGGMDLQFPHHECEIAQSVGAHGKHPARYWMHNNMLTINGEKMAKSKGNFITLEELFTGTHAVLEQAYDPMTIRFFILQAHYGSTLDFSNAALQAAEKGLQRLFAGLKIATGDHGQLNATETDVDKEIKALLDKCYQEMADDFNTAKTIAVLFDLAGYLQKLANQQLGWGELSEQGWKSLSEGFQVFLVEVLGLKPTNAGGESHTTGLVEMLIEMRQQAKVGKDYAMADQIRDNLKALGITLMDSKEGTTFRID